MTPGSAVRRIANCPYRPVDLSGAKPGIVWPVMSIFSFYLFYIFVKIACGHIFSREFDPGSVIYLVTYRFNRDIYKVKTVCHMQDCLFFSCIVFELSLLNKL